MVKHSSSILQFHSLRDITSIGLQLPQLSCIILLLPTLLPVLVNDTNPHEHSFMNIPIEEQIRILQIIFKKIL